MTDAVVYARVSSKEQSEGFSIDAQLRLLRDYSDQNDITVMREFIEVETAKAAGRPVFREMLEFLQANPDCKTILVEKTDRLYRNIKDWVTVDDLGLDINFVKEGMIVGPNAKSSDKFFHGIRVLMAKNYCDNLSEETRKGMIEKVLAGQWPHLAPFGYKNVDGPESVVPDPEEAKVIRWMFHRYAAGDISVRELYREFKRSGFSTHMPRSTFHERLRDPFYTGLMSWKGELYPGAFARLVDEPTWERVQVLLDLSSKSITHRTNDDFTYRGLILCAHCGCSIVGEIKRGKYVYYHCTENRGRCKENGWVRQEELDRQIIASLSKLKLPPELQARMSQAIRDVHKTAITSRREILAKHNAAAKNILDKIAAMYQDKLDGLLQASIWRKHHSQLTTQLKAVRTQINEYTDADLNFYVVAEQVLEFTKRAEKMFLEGDVTIRRHVINLVHSNFSLRSGTLMNTTREPFDLLINGKSARVVPEAGLEPARRSLSRGF